VVASTLPEIEAKLTGILAKLEGLPYEEIAAGAGKALVSVDATLQDVSRALNRIDADLVPGLKATIEEVRRLIATADAVLSGGVNTTLKQVATTLEEVRRPIATADAVLRNADATLLGKNAPVQQELRDALQEIGRAARSLRALTDYLERHPEALVRGKTEEKP
jgi:paraquat-inducible protein B